MTATKFRISIKSKFNTAEIAIFFYKTAEYVIRNSVKRCPRCVVYFKDTGECSGGLDERVGRKTSLE